MSPLSRPLACGRLHAVLKIKSGLGFVKEVEVSLIKNDLLPKRLDCPLKFKKESTC